MARWCFALGLSLATIFPLGAEIITKVPSADAYVRSTDPTVNHGTEAAIIANNNNGVRVSFLRFDLSGVTNVITRLKLELTVNIASANNSFDVFGLTNGDTWTETQITWGNAPAIINGFTSSSGTQAQCFKSSDCFGSSPFTSFVSTGVSAGQVDTVFDVTNGAVLNFVTASASKSVTFAIVERDPVDVPGNAWNSREAASGQPLLTVYTGSNAPPSSPEILKIYLQGGQSNSDGRALTNGLSASLLVPQNDVPFYYYLTGGAKNGDGTLGTLTTLRPGASALGGGTTFGPELTFGRALADYFAATNGASTNTVMVAIIKYAHGGTTLSVNWAPNGDASTNGDGADYLVFQQVVHDGLARLASTYPKASIELDGMIWTQGESDIDAGATATAAYGANLTKFIQDVRLTFATDTPYGTNLPFFISRISTNQTVYSNPSDPDFPNYLLLRAGQAYAANHLPNVFLIDTDDAKFSTITPWSSPGLHFDTRGQQSLGAAFGREVIRALPPSQIQAPKRSGDGVRLYFNSVSGTLQALERAPNIAGPWTLLTNLLIGASGAANYDDSNSPFGAAFYRVSRP